MGGREGGKEGRGGGGGLGFGGVEGIRTGRIILFFITSAPYFFLPLNVPMASFLVFLFLIPTTSSIPPLILPPRLPPRPPLPPSLPPSFQPAYSNWGRVVDIYAPGGGIYSASN